MDNSGVQPDLTGSQAWNNSQLMSPPSQRSGGLGSQLPSPKVCRMREWLIHYTLVAQTESQEQAGFFIPARRVAKRRRR